MQQAILFGHVIISLIGIATGFVITYAFFTSKRLPNWQHAFLSSTMLTSATGFLFPFKELLPSHILAILSLVILAVAGHAYYRKRMVGIWRPVYVSTAMAAFYFNFFVLVVQAFKHVPALHALAPTQKEPPFAVAQLITLVAFLVLGTLAVRRFRPADLVR